MATPKFAIGNHVIFPGSPGVGRVASVALDMALVEFFESAAEPVAEEQWVRFDSLRRTALGVQTRVFFLGGDDQWRAGRVVGGGPDVYAVRIPNIDSDQAIHESRLRIRWERPPKDPLQVLLSGAQESPHFQNSHAPVRRLLLADRASGGGATGITSSGVRIHAHQVNAGLRVLQDPVQRYLLADEVGMGKTIEAGFVIRQTLIDDPSRSIGVLAPAALLGQWEDELRNKFFVGDFESGERDRPVLTLSAHEDPKGWRRLNEVDLLVVDEAHLLARVTQASQYPYADLAAIAHACDRLLLLSATPFAEDYRTHLALLHLLDPLLFSWSELTHFQSLLARRRELAMAVYGLDLEPDAENPELLQFQFDSIRTLLPGDEVLEAGIQDAMQALRNVANGTAPQSDLNRAVGAVRTHISETYRLHHRVIRNRRHVVARERLDDDGIVTPFEFTGRGRPALVRLASADALAASSAIETWASACRDAILDDGLEAEPFGAVLGIYVSRSGGPGEDLIDAMEYRLGLGSAKSSSLSPEERELLFGAAPLPFERSVLDALRSATTGDGLMDLAHVIRKRVEPTTRSVVFCGRGRLAPAVVTALKMTPGKRSVHLHSSAQTPTDRDASLTAWREKGGLLVTDDTGEVGRNLQLADLVVHARMPWQPNALEQRIGRVDRYGDHATARHLIVGEPSADGYHTAWLRLLADGFGIFDNSISAVQEGTGRIARQAWVKGAASGVEGILGEVESTKAAMAAEVRRINEIDALEASFEPDSVSIALAEGIAKFDSAAGRIESSFRTLLAGAEGFRFDTVKKLDGSVTFVKGLERDPLLSPRLLRRLGTTEESRTGFFDRWSLTPGRRLFRRGNPFIDGVNAVLELDDRGQAGALWRLDLKWSDDPLVYFGFDFIVEADTSPILEILSKAKHATPIALRRADVALSPFMRRVWMPVNTVDCVSDTKDLRFLDAPYKTVPGDVNLSPKRVDALYGVMGGRQPFFDVARDCENNARIQLEAVSDMRSLCDVAALRVRQQTDKLVAQSRARAQASGLVGDASALDVEIALGRALEDGVSDPVIRLASVTCLVRSATSWTTYV